VRLTVGGRPVTVQGFVEALLQEFARGVQSEVRNPKESSEASASVRLASETRGPREAKPLAAGVNEAAKLPRLSSAPIRSYVARGWIRSVRVGRRVLIPMEVLEKVMVEGLVRGEA